MLNSLKQICRGRWSSDADGPKLSMVEIFKSEDGEERFRVECDYIFAPEAGESCIGQVMKQ